MTQNDLKDAAIYSEHLADVNQTNVVRSTEDIFNEHGVLLVAKGLEINSHMAAKIAQHKLQTPVEHSISVSNSIGAQKLYARIEEVILSRPDFTQIHQSNELEKPLRDACEYYARYKIIKQKITVLEKKLPKLFEESILGAWLALGIAKLLHSKKVDSKDAFVSALVRDIGYLHLPKHILQDDADLNDADLNAVKSHPLVSKLILEEIAGIPKILIRGAAEHHERCDGMGYPKGKSHADLSLMGQVVAMANEIQNLCQQKQGDVEMTVGNVTYFLNFNVVTHFEEIYKATTLLLKTSNVAPARCIEDKNMPEFINKLLKTTALYLEVQKSTRQLMQLLQKEQGIKIGKIVRLIGNVNQSLIESGLLSSEYTRWIQYVVDKQLKPAYVEMEAIGMMYHELEKEYQSILVCLKSLSQNELRSGQLKSMRMATEAFEALIGSR